MKKKGLLILAGIVVGTPLLFLLCLCAVTSPPSAFFFDTHLALPLFVTEEVRESDYGWPGDGARLSVFRLEESDMARFVSEAEKRGWLHAPLDGKMKKRLDDALGVSSEAIQSEMRLEGKDGLWLFVPIGKAGSDYPEYSFVLIAPGELRVYYFRFNL